MDRHAVAEFERQAISKRTKEALTAAKAKGKMLGNYERIAKAKQDTTKAASKRCGLLSPRRSISRRLRRRRDGYIKDATDRV